MLLEARGSPLPESRTARYTIRQVPHGNVRSRLASRPCLRPSHRVILVAALLLTGCGGCKEKVTEHAGTSGYWHLERAQTTLIWKWLNKIGFIAARLKDPGYQGERWWYVSPAGTRVFMRFVNLAAPDSRDADPASFMPRAVQWTLDWGFTGLGYGADLPGWLPLADKVPAIANLSLDKYSAGLTQGVFDGSVAQVSSACQALSGPLKDSKEVAGILWEARPVASPRALVLAYSAMRADSFSKRKLVTVVRDQCRNDLKLLKLRFPWARSFEDLLARSPWDEYEQIDADGEAFALKLMTEYGMRVQQEVKNRFPNYLNLGPLLDPGMPLSVIHPLALYVDVLTFAVWSHDGRLPRRYFEEIYEKTRRPILILEFGEKLGTGTGDAVVQTPEGMGEAVRRGVLGSASLPFVVGFGWTGYRDNPAEAFGLLDGAAAPREIVVKAAREANGLAQQHHRDLATPAEAPAYYDSDRFATEPPKQGIGRVPPSITIDGELGDWPPNAFQLRLLKTDQDLDPRTPVTVRAGWNDRGLVIGVSAPDDESVELLDPRVYWRDADFVEVLIDGSGARGAGYTPSSLHIALLPRGGGTTGRSAVAIAVHHDGDALKETVIGFPPVEVASSVAKTALSTSKGTSLKLAKPGWGLEALIPWAAVGVQPRPEVRIGLNVIVHLQRGARQESAFWAITRGEAGLDHPATWGNATLKEMGE